MLTNSSSNGIINQLNFLDRHGLSDSYLNNLVKNIYKVTPEKISDIARKHFKYENMKLVMVGDKQAIDKQSAPESGEQKKSF